MGWRKFVTYADEKYEVKISDAEARRYRDAFFASYRGLPLWHNRQRRLVNNLGYVTSPIGRVRHLPTINSDDEGTRAEAERQAINSPVQGFASDLTILAIIQLEQELPKDVARILGNLHDAVILEARSDRADAVAERVKHIMEHLPLRRYFGFTPTVPIIADVQIVDHWGGA
jgi:DNA polymerase-1